MKKLVAITVVGIVILGLGAAYLLTRTSDEEVFDSIAAFTDCEQNTIDELLVFAENAGHSSGNRGFAYKRLSSCMQATGDNDNYLVYSQNAINHYKEVGDQNAAQIIERELQQNQSLIEAFDFTEEEIEQFKRDNANGEDI